MRNYDEEAQQTLFNLAGLGDFSPPVIMLWTVLGALLIGAVIAAWLGRTRRERLDPIVRDYRRFCSALASAGVMREPWEGAQQFAERAAAQQPGKADAIRNAASLYIAARYGGQPEAASPFSKAVRSLQRKPTRRK